MPESQQDIDALLAEVNALAEEAVASIAVAEEDPPLASPAPSASRPSPARSVATAPLATAPAAYPSGPIPRSVKSGRIPGSPANAQADSVNRILNIEVPIIVQLSERTMPLTEILNLTTGSIIEFDKPADSELELRVNNKCIGTGQAVKVGENFGLRVVRIGSLRERIQAMGAQ
jgi:flagellar motor switch protein FliN/FliY